jgi:hypothetical protein
MQAAPEVVQEVVRVYNPKCMEDPAVALDQHKEIHREFQEDQELLMKVMMADHADPHLQVEEAEEPVKLVLIVLLTEETEFQVQ